MEDKIVYSDGDIESVILNTINKPDEFKKLCEEPGAVFHNFTKCRENLINWYPFKKTDRVLEIGAGMGAITGCLCETCGSVVSIEESSRRAEIIRERHKAYDNLQVISDDIYAHEFTEKFDYVLLIGVLEYVGINNQDGNPYIQLLAKIKELLAEDGKLLLAIENKYGLKYWCGAAEDHTSIPFESLHDYQMENITGRYGKSGVRTFSKQELMGMFKAAGFQKERFYYPLPDYKFPSAIFSDSHLPKEDDIRSIKFYYPQESELVANEKKLYKDVIDNQVFPFFANSFFVEVAKTELNDDAVEYVSHKRDYKEEFNVSTVLAKEQVVKRANTQAASMHLQQCQENVETLAKRNIPVLKSVMTDARTMQVPYCSLPLTIDVFQQALEQEQEDQLIQMVAQLKQYLDSSSERHIGEPCAIAGEEMKNEDILNCAYIDMTFINSFYQGDRKFRFSS